MLIEIRESPFNPYQEMDTYSKAHGSVGAMASFVGLMRDFNEDKQVTSLLIEHYPDMTAKQLRLIATDAMTQWQLCDVLILHRVGQIEIGQAIVLVAVWSAHRKEAFESCRMIMEQLKSTAPFWKKEQTTTGSHWVENNTKGF